MIEFALVAPILFLFFVMILDGGRLIYAYETVGEAARQGAHEAALNNSSVAAIKSEINSHSGALGDIASNATISPSTTPRAIGQPVRVAVWYTWRPVTPLLRDFGSVTVTSSTAVPVE